MGSGFEEKRERRISGNKVRAAKADKLKVKLPSGCGSTTFDRSTGEFVVTFAESIGEVL